MLAQGGPVEPYGKVVVLRGCDYVISYAHLDKYKALLDKLNQDVLDLSENESSENR